MPAMLFLCPIINRRFTIYFPMQETCGGDVPVAAAHDSFQTRWIRPAVDWSRSSALAARNSQLLIRSSASSTRTGRIASLMFAGELPRIQCDRVQLQQVMLSLIVNSIQSMSGVKDGNR
jgi:signal transduction histidine kinase